MPRERKARERGLLDRLDLLAQARERPLAQRAQHAGIDPLGPARARTELAFEDRPGRGELAERAADLRRADAEPARELDRGERAVRSREAPDQRHERPQLAREERVRQPGRHDDAERVAVFAGVLGRDPTRLARDRDGDRPPVALQLEEPLVHRRIGDRPRFQLVAREVAEPQQKVVGGVDVPRGAIGLEVLELELELGERVRVEELAQLDLTEELAELRRIHGQGLRAAFGEGRVALVDEVADVLEEERRREGRWRA